MFAEPLSPNVNRVIKIILIGGVVSFATYLAFEFGRMVLATIASPAELQDLDGEYISHICDLRAGLPPYPAQDSSRVGLLYAPLYFLVSAVFTRCDQPNLMFAARLISLVSYLLIVVTLGWLASDRGMGGRGPLVLAIVTVLVVTLSQFGQLGGWYFAVRADNLAFLFAIISWTALASSTLTPVRVLLSGVCLALSCATKQSFAFQGPAELVFLLYRILSSDSESRSLRNVLSQTTLFIGPPVLVMASMVFGGGISVIQYLFKLSQQHGDTPEFRRWFWTKDLKKIVDIEGIITMIYMGILILKKRREEFIFLTLFIVSMVGLSYLSRVHSGSVINSVIPAAFALNLVAIKAWLALLEGAWTQRRAGIVVLLGMSFALANKAARRPWGMRLYRVHETTREYLDRFVDLNRTHTMLFTMAPHLNVMAGRQLLQRSNATAQLDYFRYDQFLIPTYGPNNVPPAVSAYDQDVEAERFDYILSHEDQFGLSGNRFAFMFLFDHEKLTKHYDLVGKIKYPSEETAAPLTGLPSRPSQVFVAKTRAAALIKELRKHFDIEPAASRTPQVYDTVLLSKQR